MYCGYGWLMHGCMDHPIWITNDKVYTSLIVILNCINNVRDLFSIECDVLCSYPVSSGVVL